MTTTYVRRIAVAATAALSLALCGALPGPLAAEAPAGSHDGPAARADTVDAEAVRAAVHAFHDALAAGDSAAALARLHPDVRVFEGGHAETLAEYRSGHLGADMAFSGAVDREVLEESVSGDAGWALYLSEYRMAGTFRDEEVEARGTETMLLVRGGDGWRIRHIHWSSR